MAPSTRGSRRRRRFFRRHPMGLPTVFFVALLAAGGFWWTLRAPEETGNLGSPAAEMSIPRGCLLDDLQLCHPTASPLESLSSPPAGMRVLCRAGAGDGFVDVWADDAGRLGVQWSVPALPTVAHPFSVPWLAVWSGDPATLRTATAPSGWALLPDDFGPVVEVRSGATSLGGSLEGGLASFAVDPFGVDDDGTVRLAAHVNGDDIVLEVPSTTDYDVVKTREELRFSTWSMGRACETA